VQPGAPFDTKSAAEQDEGCRCAGALDDDQRRPILVFTERNRSMRPAPKLRSLAGAEAPRRYVDPGLMTDTPSNDARLSAAKRPSSNTAADPHARIFGLSLAALGAVCLLLNAASPSARICPQFDHDFGTTGTASPLTRVVPAPEDGSHMKPSAMIRSKECARNGGEEPGY
jgi:hypothetical protein